MTLAELIAWWFGAALVVAVVLGVLIRGEPLFSRRQLIARIRLRYARSRLCALNHVIQEDEYFLQSRANILVTHRQARRQLLRHIADLELEAGRHGANPSTGVHHE